MPRSIEPCLCGDPYCPRCFPENTDWDRKDQDDATTDYEHDRRRQEDTEDRDED